MGILAWLRRLLGRLFGGRAEVGEGAPAAALPAPTAKSDEDVEVPRIEARPVFSGEVAAGLSQRIRGLMRGVEHRGDRMLMSTLMRAVKNDGVDLPVMPKEILNIQKLLAAPDVEVQHLARAIEREPMIAAKFLAVANSSFYARGYKVTSVKQAIVRLGMSTTHMLVVAILAKSKVFKIPQYEEEAARLYAHALRSAAVAQMLARMEKLSEEDAFIAGLFHDLGRVFVLTSAGKAAAKAKEGEAPQPTTVRETAEAVDPGFSALVTEAWGYGEGIVTALYRHHEPRPEEGEDLLGFPADEERLTYVIAAADLLAQAMDDPEGRAQEQARQILDALDIELDDTLLAAAEETANAFMNEAGARAA